MQWRAVPLFWLALAPAAAAAQPTDAPLALETRIPLGEVVGRLDHLAIDLKRQRLYVAELGNDALGVIDLAAGKLAQTVTGFSEPQGVGYEPATDAVYVANGGDGSVRVLRGADLTPLARIETGDDADNIRIDGKRQQVLVGYGNGGIAVIDPAMRAKVGDVPLDGHPEGFDIDTAASRVFVNVPRRAEVAVIDLPSGATRSIPTGGLRSNFPMAFDQESGRVLTVFRNPPALMALDPGGGVSLARFDTCGDADDLFVDRRRHRIYVVCGAGAIDVLAPEGDGYGRIAQMPTVPSARTALWVPELDRLYVAVSSLTGGSAAIWVFRPTP